MSFVPPAGWYQDPSGGTARRWWDGGQWTEHLEQQLPPVPAMAPAYAASTDQYAVANGYVSQAATSSVHSPTAPAEPNVYSTAGRLAHQYSRDPMIQQTRAQYANWQTTDPNSMRVWTVGAWFIALSPIWLPAAFVGIAFGVGLLMGVTGSASVYGTSASSLLTTILGILAGAALVGALLMIAAAVADRRALVRAGYRRTASPFWILLSPLGYLIARTVLLREQVGRGASPLIVFAGILGGLIALRFVLSMVNAFSILGVS